MFYACYELNCSDVAVFKEKADRDLWVENADFFGRIPLEESDIDGMVDKNSNPVDDPIEDNVKWLINFANM